MKIYKRYKDPDEVWLETSVKECLEHTEGSGFWKPGTVLDMLKQGQTVFTPFAEYKLSSTK